MTQENTPASPDSPTPPPPKRRRWLKIVVAIVVVLLLLVLLIPTIAGFGFVRSIVVGRINQNLDGRVEVDGWSLGWFSGTSLRGVRVFDPSGDKVASIDKVTTQLTLLSALRGNYAMGKTDVDGCEFWVKLDKEGQSNVAKLPKKHGAKPAEPESTTTELPNISGDFYVNAAKGQIERPDTPIARISKADIHATVPGIHDTITQHADIETALGDAPAGKILMDAKVPAEALTNIASRHAPGQTGTIDIAWTMPNLQPVVEELKSAGKLLPGVTITGGEFNQAAHVDIREKDIAISNRLVFSAQGTRKVDGK